MCLSVIVGNTECETQYDLHKALGGDLIYEQSGFKPEFCLCPVDLAKTAETFGMKITGDGIFHFEMSPIE